MKEDVLAPCNKGVQLWIVDEVNIDGSRAQAASPQKRIREIPKSFFDLRIAQQALSLRLRHQHHRNQKGREGPDKESGECSRHRHTYPFLSVAPAIKLSRGHVSVLDPEMAFGV